VGGGGETTTAGVLEPPPPPPQAEIGRLKAAVIKSASFRVFISQCYEVKLRIAMIGLRSSQAFIRLSPGAEAPPQDEVLMGKLYLLIVLANFFIFCEAGFDLAEHADFILFGRWAFNNHD